MSRTIETAVGGFRTDHAPSNDCQIVLFEMVRDGHLHVNVTHKYPTNSAPGWAGPVSLPQGFVHNRTFSEAQPTGQIVRHVRDMVLRRRFERGLARIGSSLSGGRRKMIARTVIAAEGPVLHRVLDATCRSVRTGLSREACGKFHAARMKTLWGGRHQRTFALVDGDNICRRRGAVRSIRSARWTASAHLRRRLVVDGPLTASSPSLRYVSRRAARRRGTRWRGDSAAVPVRRHQLRRRERIPRGADDGPDTQRDGVVAPWCPHDNGARR